MRRFSITIITLGVIGLLISGTAYAEEAVRDHDITIDDYPSVAMIVGCAMSPDGEYIAYLDLRWKDVTDKRDTDIWVVPTAGGDARRLTFETAADGSPQWSPDSRWIYFTSARGDDDEPPYNGQTQVWRIAVDGDRLVPVTRFEKGMDGYELSKDGRTLYYVTHRDQEDEVWKDLRAKHKDTIDFSHGTRQVSEIWKLNLQNWRTEKLVDEKRYIRGFTVSPNERCIAMHTTPDSELITNEGWSRVDVFDMETEEIQTLPDKLYREDAPSPYGWLEELAWASDSKALAFSVGWDGYPNELFVAEWTNDETAVRKLKRPTDGMTVGGGLHWRDGTRELCFLGEHRARQHVYSIADIRDGIQGELRLRTPGDIAVHAFSYGETGSAPAIVVSSPTRAREVFIADAPGRYRQLTDMNPQMADWKMPQISLVSWKGANGDEVEGVLELPYDHDPATDGPLPMIVELHGGPTAATHIGFRFWCYGRTIMAANGYALLSPNYRGSTGYGDKFMTELIGRENEIEVEDILTGVETMIERGIADADKLGVMGWSNGGFLTNAVITHSTRFKAASSGAGIADMLLQWSVEDTPGHVINYMEGLPWEDPKEYFKASPVWNLHKVVTPTLIHCGGNDARVPVAHSRALYRALHKYRDVPAMLLVYPGQGHGLGKCSMRQAKMEWDLAWFKRYILGESDDEAAETEGDDDQAVG
ncbi:MAG: prolyl oligopeptidase family serine peptidase [Planctomycetes bacterium]|nr:prolyl oligopeptidase family serine peptidase [Planctomycetota bacterium]